MRRHGGPADGAGLIVYQVTVTEDGGLVINLNTDDPATTTTEPSTTTSSILVTQKG